MNFSGFFRDEDHRHQMALQRGSIGEFFRPTAAHDSILAERRRWLGAEPHTCCALLPPGWPLLDECIELACDWQALSSEEQMRIAAIDSAPARCCEFSETWEPDFLLLKAGDDGSFRLVGGCVCFPSSWNLAEKIGQPLDFIHGPVPGLNEQLGRSIDAFLARLAPGQTWLRHNWGLSRSPELNQHPGRALPRLDASATLEEAWLRVEHQALIALPRSGGILFGIRIAMHPLAEVKQDPVAAARLAHALRTMPETVASYKGLAGARKRLVELLQNPGGK